MCSVVVLLLPGLLLMGPGGVVCGLWPRVLGGPGVGVVVLLGQLGGGHGRVGGRRHGGHWGVGAGGGVHGGRHEGRGSGPRGQAVAAPPSDHTATHCECTPHTTDDGLLAVGLPVVVSLPGGV